MNVDSTAHVEPFNPQPPDKAVRTAKRSTVIAGVVWLIYLTVLTATLLYYFPWRKPAEGSADRFMSELVAGMPEEKKKELLESYKKLREATLPEPSFLGKFKSFRRMPCWSEAARDELVSVMKADPVGGDRARVTLSFDFAEPIRAWDRFALEMTYGIGLAAIVQIGWILGLYVRKRRQRKQTDTASNAQAA